MPKYSRWSDGHQICEKYTKAYGIFHDKNYHGKKLTPKILLIIRKNYAKKLTTKNRKQTKILAEN